MLLSVVIPTYRQEKTIAKDIYQIQQSLDSLGCKYEIIIVFDGEAPKNLKKTPQFKSPKIKILSYEKNLGKGHAVRYGMLHAKGNIIGFIDAGMDINPSGLLMLLNHMDWYNADIIIGSKLHPASKINYPLSRKILSRGYRILTSLLFGFKVKDTQVGIKFFKKKVVKDVLPKMIVKSFAFDVEILAIAYHLKYTKIFEAPVEINFQNNSTITSKKFWRIIISMLIDTLAIYYRLRILKYYDRKKIQDSSSNLNLRLNFNK